LGLGLTSASGVDVRGPIRRLKQFLGAILCVDSIKSQNSQTLIGCSSGPSVIGGYSRLVIAVIEKENVSICTFMTGDLRKQSSSSQETHRAGNHPTWMDYQRNVDPPPPYQKQVTVQCRPRGIGRDTRRPRQHAENTETFDRGRNVLISSDRDGTNS
jgi:hypothetical protein